jgi:hypothetical protein
MGLEPTIFRMAKAGRRPRLFARVRRNVLFAAASGPASERQRTPSERRVQPLLPL